MAWVKVESRVARHPKFHKAGPSASWLWLCGVAYCQEGQTDGLIPTSALPFLGVAQWQPLVRKLVDAGLWHEDADGYRVHDYLKHNRSSLHIQDISDKRSVSGAMGGRPKQTSKANGKQIAFDTQKQPENPVQDSTETPISTETQTATAAPRPVPASLCVPDRPFDVWLRQLQEIYPGKAVTNGHLTSTAFLEALIKHPAGADEAWALMRANLENQRNGHQWRVKRMVPRLDNWLRDGLWLQVHEADEPSATQGRPRGGYAPSTAARWVCPHVDACGSPGGCSTLLALRSTGKYPIRPDVAYVIDEHGVPRETEAA